MRRETIMRLGDVTYKFLTPITFGLAALWASQLTDSIKELKAKLDSIESRVQAVDTRSAVNDQRLRDHIEADRGRQ